MISPISSHISFSSSTLPPPNNTKLSHPFLSFHNMIMSSHLVQHTPSPAYTMNCIPQVMHTPSTANTEYCTHWVLYHPMVAVSRSQLVSHLLLDRVALNSLHSDNDKIRSKKSPGSRRASVLIYHFQINHLQVHQYNVRWCWSHNSMTQLFGSAALIIPEAPKRSCTGLIEHDVHLRCSASTLMCSSMLLTLQNRIQDYSEEYEVVFRMPLHRALKLVKFGSC